MGLAEIIGNYEPNTLWASSLEILWVGDWKTSNIIGLYLEDL